MATLTPIEIDPATFLYEHCSLPALPAIARRYQELVQSADVSIGAAAKLLSTDAGLVAEILKVVNSAYFGLPHEIRSIKTAVGFLGIREIDRIVLTNSVFKALSSRHAEEFRNLFHHSILTALAAQFIAREFDHHLHHGELWTAALLHDIGKLVYLKFFPEHYLAASKLRKETGCLHHEAEQLVDIPPSSYLGTLLCDRWRLPRLVKGVCASHSLIDLISADIQLSPLERVIALANLLSLLVSEWLSESAERRISETVRSELTLTENEFQLLFAEIFTLKDEADRLAS
ncbi:MAG: HDOD domain-containing protein [Rhodothermales bacterium]